MGAQMQRGAYSRVPGLRRRNAQLHWAMRGQDPLLIGYFFLKRLSKARRASSGRADPDVVLRSTATCIEKNVQALRARLSAMRSGTGWVHSKWAPGSK